MFFLFLKNKKTKKQSKQKSQNSRLPLHRPRRRRHWDAKDLASFDLRRRLLDDDRNLDNTSQRMEVLPSADNSLRPSFVNAFKNPICIRRKIRRAFLFSSGFAGRGKVRKARWNKNSEVSCNGH